MIKIFDNVYANKEIIEGERDNKDIVSLQRIGKTLKIGNGTFEDLDEVRLYFLIIFSFAISEKNTYLILELQVMDRYIDPLVAHLMTMLNYRKFQTGTKSEIDGLLTYDPQIRSPSTSVCIQRDSSLGIECLRILIGLLLISRDILMMVYCITKSMNLKVLFLYLI